MLNTPTTATTSTDYVLVYEEETKKPGGNSQFSKWRTKFQNNLRKIGMHIEMVTWWLDMASKLHLK